VHWQLGQFLEGVGLSDVAILLSLCISTFFPMFLAIFSLVATKPNKALNQAINQQSGPLFK
jgi:hypothetical protein